MTSYLFSKKKNLVHDKNDIKCILGKKKKKVLLSLSSYLHDFRVLGLL